MMLHLLILKVRKHNIKTDRGVEGMGRVRGVKKIKSVKKMEKAIREIM